MNIYESGANKRKRIRRRRAAERKEAKAGRNKGKEAKEGKGEKKETKIGRRKRITIAGASDSTISGNDRKKERSFVRTKRTVEERSAKKNES